MSYKISLSESIADVIDHTLFNSRVAFQFGWSSQEYDVTDYARLWQIDWKEIGRSGKNWDIVLQKSTYSFDLL